MFRQLHHFGNEVSRKAAPPYPEVFHLPLPFPVSERTSPVSKINAHTIRINTAKTELPHTSKNTVSASATNKVCRRNGIELNIVCCSYRVPLSRGLDKSVRPMPAVFPGCG